MDKEAKGYFRKVKQLAEKHLKDAIIEAEDYGNERSLLTIEGWFGNKRVIISELILPRKRRRYAYYLLDRKDNSLISGFDNSPDITVTKIKYPTMYKLHKGELIPHIHGRNKEKLEIADEEMDCSKFFEWLKGCNVE